MKSMHWVAVIFSISLAVFPPWAAADEKAVVYIWKTWHPNTIGRAAYDVFLNERPIAKLDRARYFVALVPPGRHVFRTKTQEAGAVELDLQPGQTYFLRMDTSNAAFVGRPVLTPVSAEEGRAGIKQARPISSDDIKDRSIVVMNYDSLTVPSTTGQSQPMPQKIAIQITSEPLGAEVYVDGVFVGSTPATISVFVGSHVLKVTRPGFSDWERRTVIDADSTPSFNAVLVKPQP